MTQKIRLNDEDKEQIRIILESQDDVGTKFHGIIANIVFKAYTETTDPAYKLVYGLEIFSKLMHLLEDIGLHCLMWLESEKSGDPVGEFTSRRTKHIFGFYKRCAEGLPDDEIAAIHCIWPPERMLAAGKMSKEELPGYTRCFKLSCETLRIIFKRLRRHLYGEARWANRKFKIRRCDKYVLQH